MLQSYLTPQTSGISKPIIRDSRQNHVDTPKTDVYTKHAHKWKIFFFESGLALVTDTSEVDEDDTMALTGEEVMVLGGSTCRAMIN